MSDERIESVRAADSARVRQQPIEVFDEHGRPIGRAAQPAAARRSREWVSNSARAGVSMGSALAIAISWSVHKSIVWAIVHGFLSWIYVIYYALTR
jgi:hypothetical protein